MTDAIARSRAARAESAAGTAHRRVTELEEVVTMLTEAVIELKNIVHGLSLTPNINLTIVTDPEHTMGDVEDAIQRSISLNIGSQTSS